MENLPVASFHLLSDGKNYLSFVYFFSDFDPQLNGIINHVWWFQLNVFRYIVLLDVAEFAPLLITRGLLKILGIGVL